MRSLVLVLLSLTACGRDGLRLTDDAGTGGGTGTTCAGLDLAACRARPGCEADTCLECSCAPVFVGCRAARELPHACPLLQCAQPNCCRTDPECAPFQATCAPQGAPRGCGACVAVPAQCVADTDCTNGTICEPRECGCSGERDCVPGCGASAPCAAGQSCVAKRCVATPCATASNCGASTFDCVNGACARRTCSSDAQCSGGFCVLGLCEEALGECRQPVP